MYNISYCTIILYYLRAFSCPMKSCLALHIMVCPIYLCRIQINSACKTFRDFCFQKHVHTFFFSKYFVRTSFPYAHEYMSGVTPEASGRERTTSPASFTMTARDSRDPTMLARWMGVIPLASLRSRMASLRRRNSMMATLPFSAAMCSGD